MHTSVYLGVQRAKGGGFCGARCERLKGMRPRGAALARLDKDREQ